jgi:tRNA modification GTPase
MPYSTTDTIVAISSPAGPAARGIVRLSGPATAAVVERLFTPPVEGVFEQTPGVSIFSGSVDIKSLGGPVPTDLYLWPEGHSYTGETVAEFHTFGSPPVLDALVAACTSAACSGAAERVRLAQPGEFTLRAFLSGRLDLTQAEAVLGVIDATDADSLDVALEQLAGGLAGPLAKLRSELIDLLGHLEAGFDFADEQIEFITEPQLAEGIAKILAELDRLVSTVGSRADSRDLPRVVLVGRPNVGKSSLFNALLGDSVDHHGAIVSSMPGTTRDYLSVELNLDSARFVLIDTAGMAEKTADPLNRQANEMAQREASTAEIRIICLEADQKPNPQEQKWLDQSDPARTILLRTKADLVDSSDPIDPAGEAIPVSTVDSRGIDRLEAAIRDQVLTVGRSGGSVVATTAARATDALRGAQAALQRGLALLGDDETLLAGELREALDAIGQVAGAVYTDEILDQVFTRFCIGK